MVPDQIGKQKATDSPITQTARLWKNCIRGKHHYLLGGGFKYFLVLPLLGEITKFDWGLILVANQ